MLLNLEPLIKNRNYRLLYLGQTISFLGGMISYVAIPYQVFQITQSSMWVGALGGVQLVPVVFFGLFGGSVADRMDRRKLLLGAEIIMSLAVLALWLHSFLPQPHIGVVFFLAFLLQAANGFHRPAMEALTQSMVEPKHYAAVGALGSLKYSVSAIVGPAIGGALIAWKGLQGAYIIDFISFSASLTCLYLMKIPPLAAPVSQTPSLKQSMQEGVQYAIRRPELVGTYIVDIVAMTFAFPVALFPEMAQRWGGAQAAGILFSSMAIGSLFVTVFSGWTSKVKRHGKAVILAAGVWGVAIFALGFMHSLPLAVFCLILAGGADMISGLFRSVIWNETIPNTMRGRLAGIEMISYMTGPLLGNLRAGSLAGFTSLSFSIVSGGLLCVIGVTICAFTLPRFWNYLSNSSKT